MNNGNGAASLIQLFRKHGYNQDVNIELATVVSPPPSIKIRLNDGVVLDKDDVIIAESLTEHKRIYSVTGGVTNAEMTIKTPLTVGDKVIVASAQNNQQYYILDKAVTL